MDKKPDVKKKGVFKTLADNYKSDKALFLTYFILRALVIVVMVNQYFNKSYDSVFLCVLTLVLFTLPSFIEHRLSIELPSALEIIVLLFIFSAEILGEIREYYIIYPYWDSMLHTVNGFLSAAIGVAAIDVLNRSDKIKFNMSPVFVAFFAFCFSMTVGVIWEFFEFFMDSFFHTDMQKDTVIKMISSVYLNSTGSNVPVIINVKDLAVNGVDMKLGGYLDIGLIDTMNDLLVNFMGATVFSIIGYFYIKNRGKSSIAKYLLPTRKNDEAPAKETRKLP